MDKHAATLIVVIPAPVEIHMGRNTFAARMEVIARVWIPGLNPE